MTVSAGSLLSLQNLLTHCSLSASCKYKLPECNLHKQLASAAPVTYISYIVASPVTYNPSCITW